MSWPPRVRGRMTPPDWYYKAQAEWNAEDWRLAKHAGEVRTTPYDPPPPRALGDQPVVAPLPPVSAGFSWFSKTRRREANVRSDAIDRAIEKALRPR